MSISKFIFNKHAFSLVEVTIGVALLGLAGVAVVKLTDVSNRDLKWAEMTLQKTEFFSSAEKYLKSSTGCLDLIDSSPYTVSKSLELKKWKVAGIEGDPGMPVKQGRKFKNFTISSLSTSALDTTNLKTIYVDGLSVEAVKTNLKVSMTLDLKVNLKKKSTSPVRKYSQDFYIPVIAEKITKKIRGCESTDIQTSCKEMGMEYDSCTKTCRPSNPEEHCFINGSYAVRHDSSQGYKSNMMDLQFENPKTLHYKCLPGEVEVYTGGTGDIDEVSCGKGCYKYPITNIVYVSCLKCLKEPVPCPSSSSSGGSVSGSTSGGGLTSGSTAGGGLTSGSTAGGGLTSGSTAGSTSSGGGTGCFVAGTMISMFDGTKKPIEEVTAGDELVDFQGKRVISKKLFSYLYKGDIYSINEGPYFFTPNHPFLTMDGWKSLDPEMSMLESPGLQVSLLKVGDALIKNSEIEIIFSLKSIKTEEYVYNFTVSDSHEYMANDYAVHNALKK
jgi:hypothetical protein